MADATTVFEVYPGLVGTASTLPLLADGDIVTAISVDGSAFVDVPGNGTRVTLDGAFLGFSVDAQGSLSLTPLGDDQDLINRINDNAGSSDPLSDTITYRVTHADGSLSVDTDEVDLGDVTVQTPATPPYAGSGTVASGGTIGIGGVTVTKQPSTNGTDVSGTLLGVGVTVFDPMTGTGHGTLSVDPTTPGGGGTVVYGNGGSTVIIAGTQAEINADLSTLTYTGGSVGLDDIVITFVDNPTPGNNLIVGSITVGPGMPAPVDASAITVFQVSDGVTGSGQGSPFLASGDRLVAISTDDINFTLVPTDGTSATVAGAYLSFQADADGNLTAFDDVQDLQAVIDAINANAGAATPLSDTLYYKVAHTDGTTSVYSYVFALGDTAFVVPTTPPYATPQTIVQGATIDIGGLDIDKQLSTGETDNEAFVLTASVTVFDFDRQQSDGMVAIDPAVAGGGGAVSYDADHGSVTITGTLAQIKADLSTLTYTAVQTGTDSIIFTVTDSPTPDSNQIVGSVLVDSVACFCPGTLILTAAGERPVESLAVGDSVVTASGVQRAVRWIGRRAYAGRFLARSPHLHPVRIRAGALGPDMPRRDLLVSPEHAMFVDGVLVPARCLVDGDTIVHTSRRDRVEYIHVELDSHDVLLAEGAPAESFLDDGSRGMFANAAEYALLYPQAAPAGTFCAPRVESGPGLAAIRHRLAATRLPDAA